MSKHTIAMGLVLAATTITIASAEQRISSMIGAGSESCGSWTANRRGGSIARLSARVQNQQWLFGFLSAFGVAGKGLDPLHGMDDEGVVAWVDNYCREHPIDSIQDAGVGFVLFHPL
jgi:hypothetical protein